MKYKITVTLDREVIDFLDAESQGNRSESINRLLLEHRRQTLERQTIAALQADLADSEYQADLADWDAVVGDGIDA
jgi:Arc/MetJ-type ribon-helix-helix transcriptional regulator